jgi:hypothetical protein
LLFSFFEKGRPKNYLPEENIAEEERKVADEKLTQILKSLGLKD